MPMRVHDIAHRLVGQQLDVRHEGARIGRRGAGIHEQDIVIIDYDDVVAAEAAVA